MHSICCPTFQAVCYYKVLCLMAKGLLNYNTARERLNKCLGRAAYMGGNRDGNLKIRDQ